MPSVSDSSVALFGYEMATGGDRPTDDRSTLTWSYRSPGTLRRLKLIWIQMESTSFRLFPTSWDCIHRWPETALVRVLLGRDDHSVCALVPDQRVIDRGFHEVTLVDMSDTAGPDVSVADIEMLQLQWPVLIINSVSWLQQEHEQLRINSKKRYRDIKAAGCTFCGKWIKIDMNR